MEANGTDYATEKQNLATRLGVAAAARCSPTSNARRRHRDKTRGAARGDRAGRPLQLRDHQARSRRPVPRRAGRAGRRSRADRPGRRDGRRPATTPDTRTPITFQQARAGRVQRRGHSALRPHLHRHAREQVDAGDPGLGLRAEDQRATCSAGNQRRPATTRPATRASRTTPRSAAPTTSASPTTASGTATPPARTPPQDLPLPDNTQPGLASSPFAATCTQTAAPTTTSSASRTCSTPSRRPA